MILIRYILLFIIGFLIVRAFMRYAHEEKHSVDKTETGKKNTVPSKKVSKRIGEFIDYEEIKKK